MLCAIESPLAPFELRDERLRLAKPIGKLLLCQDGVESPDSQK
jgi:hypothetical protein